MFSAAYAVKFLSGVDASLNIYSICTSQLKNTLLDWGQDKDWALHTFTNSFHNV